MGRGACLSRQSGRCKGAIRNRGRARSFAGRWNNTQDVDGPNVTDITANAPGAALPKLKFLDATLYAVAMNIGLRWIAVAAAAGPAAFPLWLVALFAFYV